MGRYSDDFLERLKRAADLVALARARGANVKKCGDSFKCLCFFHQETEPSLCFFTHNGMMMYKCHGCGRTGDGIKFIMEADGVAFRTAVEQLAHECGIPLPTVEERVRQTTAAARSSSPPVDLSADDQALLQQVFLDYYPSRLKQSPQALSYLESRGFRDGNLINDLHLGFSDRSLGLRLPIAKVKAGKEVRERMIKVGILRQSGHEHFNGAVTIPVINEAGLVTEVYGRKIRDDLRQGTAYHLYLKGPHRGIWNLSALTSKELIITESLIDAMSFLFHGISNVTSLFGAGGLTEELFRAILDKEVEVLKFALDNDDPGNNYSIKHAERFMKEGLDCYRIVFPRGMDANDFIRKVADPRESLLQLINGAVWMGNGRPTATTKAPVLSAPVIEQSLQTAASSSSPAEQEAPRPEIPHEETVLEANQENAKKASADPEEVSEKGPAEPVISTEEVQPEETPVEVEQEESAEEAGEEQTTPGPGDGEAVIKKGHVEMTFEDRIYRAYGLEKNMTYGVLKVMLRVMRDELYFDDAINFYSKRSRLNFILSACEEILVREEVLKRDLGRLVLKLEDLQDRQIMKVLDMKHQPVVLTDQEREEAMAFLTSPNLVELLLVYFEKCGVVGEQTNLLVCYLAGVSRKSRKPLGIIVQSSSGAGKTYLMDAFLSFMAEEEYVKYSALSGQSLFYQNTTLLKHKILAIVEEEGVQRATYALKLLLTEGELTMGSTGKDPHSGRFINMDYHVEGPTAPIMATSNLEINEELENRTIVLTVDESRMQTRAIQKQQRELETIEGYHAELDAEQIRKMLKNAQRLLRPIRVFNPYARDLSFLDERTRTRRDQPKYLTLIKSITLLHQYQRPIKRDLYRQTSTEYIEATLEDIELANKLADEVLGRSLDELAPQTRRFLTELDAKVTVELERKNLRRIDYRFSRRDACALTGWSYDQVRVHLNKLVDLEYVLVHRGGRGQCFVYELLYDGKGKDGKPFMMGLINVEELRKRQSSSTTESLGEK